MKFSDWLDQEKGRNKAVAEHFGRSAGAVSQWRTNGVPRDLMLAVREFTKGEVSIEEMFAVQDEDA